MKRYNLMIVLLGTTLLFTACATTNNNAGNQTVQSPAPTVAPSPTGTPQGTTTATNVDAIVKQNCIACHGDTLDGKGNGKKNLQQVGARLSKEEITTVLTNGRNGMPAFKGKLSDVEITSLADWLSAKK